MSTPISSNIPPPQENDIEDVHMALSAAATLWRRGEGSEALRWLRRAAGTAADQGADERAVQLYKAAADMASSLEQSAQARSSHVQPRAADLDFEDVDETVIHPGTRVRRALMAIDPDYARRTAYPGKDAPQGSSPGDSERNRLPASSSPAPSAAAFPAPAAIASPAPGAAAVPPAPPSPKRAPQQPAALPQPAATTSSQPSSSQPSSRQPSSRQPSSRQPPSRQPVFRKMVLSDTASVPAASVDATSQRPLSSKAPPQMPGRAHTPPTHAPRKAATAPSRALPRRGARTDRSGPPYNLMRTAAKESQPRRGSRTLKSGNRPPAAAARPKAATTPAPAKAAAQPVATPQPATAALPADAPARVAEQSTPRLNVLDDPLAVTQRRPAAQTLPPHAAEQAPALPSLPALRVAVRIDERGEVKIEFLAPDDAVEADCATALLVAPSPTDATLLAEIYRASRNKP